MFHRSSITIFLSVHIILSMPFMHAMQSQDSTFAHLSTIIRNNKTALLVLSAALLTLTYTCVKPQQPSIVQPISPEVLQKNKDIHVIFDLNGVLTKNGGETKIVGLRNFILYALTHNPFTLKDTIRSRLYAFLSTLEERHPHEIPAYDEQGNQLPQIMCTWMKNTKTPQDIVALVNERAAQECGDLESSIVVSIARMMFTPELMIQTQHWVPQALQFVDELKAQGYKVHILSNFESRSFQFLQQEYPEIFAKFDSIVVSGDVGLLKPDPQIYEHALRINNIERNKAFFIDDTFVNVSAAGEQGIRSSLCKNSDINAVRRDFYAWRGQLVLPAAEYA